MKPPSTASILTGLLFGAAPPAYLALVHSAYRHGAIGDGAWARLHSVFSALMLPGRLLLAATPYSGALLTDHGPGFAKELVALLVASVVGWLLFVAALCAVTRSAQKRLPETYQNKLPKLFPGAAVLLLSSLILGVLPPGYRQMLADAFTYGAIGAATHSLWDSLLELLSLPGLLMVGWTSYSGRLTPVHDGFREDFFALLLANSAGWYLLLLAASLGGRVLRRRLATEEVLGYSPGTSEPEEAEKARGDGGPSVTNETGGPARPEDRNKVPGDR